LDYNQNGKKISSKYKNMDFGKISKQELEKTNLSLKPDNIFNEKVLKNT
jgi:hypothetical protein